MTGLTVSNVLNASADTTGRAALTHAFRQAGFNVWEATSSDEALNLAPKQPDLILLDHALPGKSVFEICSRLKEQPATANIPVFCLGGTPGAVILTLSCAAGSLVDRFLRRPVQLAEVVEAAQNLLQIRKTALLNHLFFDAASDAVVIINSSGAIVHLNTQIEKLFGYRHDELLDQPLELLLSEPLRAGHAEYRRRYFENPLPRPMGSNFMAVGQRKDGSKVPIDIALSPLQTESGLYVASSIRDMSRQRQLEDELRQRTRDLEDADRHKDQFLSTLAHELRSPLAAIAYSAELLRRPDVVPDVRDKAARIVIEEVAFVQRLLDDLGELTRIRHGELRVRKTPTDLGEVARLAAEISRPLIEQRQHDLEIAIPPALLLIDGDATRIAQIITNLLNNAAWYTPEGGHIRMSIEQEDGAAVIKVKDDGIGIPKDMLTRIFDLFTRTDAARSNHTGGLGIGLAYARRLAEIQDGSVQAFSDGEGRGSEFVVRLPLTRCTDATTRCMSTDSAAIPSTQPSAGSRASQSCLIFQSGASPNTAPSVEASCMIPTSAAISTISAGLK